MTFTKVDYGYLLQRRTEGAYILDYLLHTFGPDDPNTVDTAGLLGALDNELLRRDGICQALIACRHADREA